MAGPDLTGYTPTPGRKIYDDASGEINAFMQGLGNANVNPLMDIAEGLDKGITLATKANQFLEDIGPTGAERRRLELDTARAQASTQQSQATINAVKAKATALNEQAIIEKEKLDLQQGIFDANNGIRNSQLATEGIEGMSQIQDAASLTAYIRQPKFGPIRADKQWGANVRNSAALLMHGATPEEQVELIQAAEAAAPGSEAQLSKVASSEAQQLIMSPLDTARLRSANVTANAANAANARANAPAKLTADEKVEQKLQGIATGLMGQISTAMGGRTVNDVDIQFLPETNSIDVVTKSGTKLGSVPIPPVGTGIDAAARKATLEAMINNGIGELHRGGPKTAPNGVRIQQPQGQAVEPPSAVNPDNKVGVSKLLETKDGNDLVGLRSSILGDSNYSTWDKELQSLKMAVAAYDAPPKSTALHNRIERLVEGIFKGKKDVTPQMVEAAKEAAIKYYDGLEDVAQADRDHVKSLEMAAEDERKKRLWRGASSRPTIASVKADPKNTVEPAK